MKSLHPLRLPNDPVAMTKAVDWCQANGHHVRRTSAFQLKFGPINFYPQTGTIYLDGGHTLDKKGFEVLKEILAADCSSGSEIYAFCCEKGYVKVPDFIDLSVC